MAERRSPPSSPNWACLHRDVMDSILDRLVHVSDLIRFRAVCKSWNSLCLSYYKEKRILAINHHLPWLVIEPSKEGTKINNLYDFTSSKIRNYPYEIPFNHGPYTKSFNYGSSHGWLFVVHKYPLIMFNPISGTIIPVPPLIDRLRSSRRIPRITLSRDPSTCLTSPFEVLITPCSTWSKWKGGMAHWKSGDTIWTNSQFNSTKEGEYYSPFHDFIFYKDRMLGIAGVCSTSTDIPRDVVDVITINIDNGIKIKKIASTPTPGLKGLHYEEGHLVETTKGELLMVHRYVDNTSSTFRVYKLIICSNDSAKVIPIKNLNGDSLFLGRFSHGVSVLASNYPACMSNSIYYSSISRPCEAFEVFNIEDESVSCCSLPKGYKKVLFGNWIVPSMKL